MGPFAMSDLAGLDVGWRIRKALGVKAEIADALCEQGRYGQKTGKRLLHLRGGLARRRARSRGRGDHRRRLEAARHRAPRTIDKKEIVERLIFPMINEGARILEEGIAHAAGRHRRDLGLRLRLAGLARRPDVLCRHGRARAWCAIGSRSSPRPPATSATSRRLCSQRLADEGATFGSLKDGKA